MSRARIVASALGAAVSQAIERVLAVNGSSISDDENGEEM